MKMILITLPFIQYTVLENNLSGIVCYKDNYGKINCFGIELINPVRGIDNFKIRDDAETQYYALLSYLRSTERNWLVINTNKLY